MLTRFQKMVDGFQHRVFTFAYYYTGNREEAEDVTQEVLLKLWHHLDRVEDETAGAWLSRVTRNACFDLLRRRRSRGKVFDEYQDGAEVAAVAPGGTSAESGAISWDLQRHLERALATIDEPYRTIIILREIQGLKYVEISDTLEMPLNTVKTYLHRARRRLREQLEEVHCYAEPA